jgi:amino acid adenylation domain-containing protein
MYNSQSPDTSGFGPLLAENFLQNCRAFADNPALHIGVEYFSYEQVLEKVEIIFAQLSIRPPAPMVGVYCVESVWTYAAIVAISLSGSCYVPLDPKIPHHRVQAQVTECKPGLIISPSEIYFAGCPVLVIDPYARPTPCRELVRQKYAYLLFTSGTTGKPKGVLISKNNVAAFFHHYSSQYDFNATDRFLQPYDLAFDVSVFSIFAAWRCGACVYVVPFKGIKYVNILTTLRDHGITVSSMVPSVLTYLNKYLDEVRLPALRYSFFSGDALLYHQAQAWQTVASSSRIINGYGPTETTIVCTSYEYAGEQADPGEIVPIGKPFEGMNYILADQESYGGESGELCLSGPQVFDGYAGDKGNDNFLFAGNEKFYRTGDLVSERDDGNLLFHGRNDSQFKISGYRVEAAEVENAIFRVTQKRVVVLAMHRDGVNTLVAFCESVPDDQQARQLARLLPAYMIPSEFFRVDSFPLTSNGKIDRRQLNQFYYERLAIK